MRLAAVVLVFGLSILGPRGGAFGASGSWSCSAFGASMLEEAADTTAGDGVADRVLRQPGGFPGNRPWLYVQENQVTGRANLLSAVHRCGAWNEAELFEPQRLQEFLDADNRDRDGYHPDCTPCPTCDPPCPGPPEMRVPRRFAPMHPRASGTDLTAHRPAWLGNDEAVFVSGDLSHAARMGGRIGGSAGRPPTNVAGAFSPGGYVRTSLTRTFNAGAGFASIGGNLSANDTSTTTDVLDMNGDGIADVVASERVTLGRLRAADPSASGLGFPDGRIRRRVGGSYGINLGVSPILHETSATGRPLAEQTHSPSEGGGSISASVGAGIAIGRNRTTDDLVDMNGDGLPDRVKREGGDQGSGI
ncbi:MAG: hypothetical protein AAB131_13645, partial [Actinomycetota bacterium]